MAGSVNKVILVGNLGRDPEIRFTQAGKKIANFSIATSEQWRDRQSGERRERTEWHRIVVFNEGLADVVERFVKKAASSTSKVNCAPANGRDRTARTTTAPKLCWKVSTAT